MMKNVKSKNKRSLLVLLSATIVCASLGIGLSGFTHAEAEESPAPVATWTLAAEGKDYSVKQHTMTEVCGVSGSGLQIDAMLWRQDTSASSDTSTNLIYSPSVALNAAGAYYAIHFTQNADKLIGTDINTVVVKLYAHLTSDGSAYSTANGGIRLYAPDDSGENNSGYMIPGDIVQDQWVDLVISGEELAELADSNGYFSGFTAGNAAVSNLRFNNGWQYTDDFSWIAFDSFTAYDEYYVSFNDGTTTTGQLVSADTPITAPVVEKEGYELLGWYDENGEKVDLSVGVKNSCTLTAKWQPVNGTLNASDGNGYNDASQTNRKVKEVCGAALTVSDMMFWKSASDVSRADAPSGYPIYSASTNHVGASPTITFGGPVLSLKNSDGTWKSVVLRIYAHLTTDKSAYFTENGGIRLYDADDDGTNNSGYMIPADIPQDQWVYLEISGDDVAELADKNGDFSGFAVGSNLEGGASGEDGKKMYPGGSWAAEGAYVLFDTFTVGEYEVTLGNGNKETMKLADKAISLTLNESLQFNYKVKLPELSFTGVDYQITFTYMGETTEAINPTVDESGRQVYVFDGITPQYMTEDLVIKFIATAGEQNIAWNTRTISVQSYCEKLLNRGATGELRTLLVDILNYGAAAQKYEGLTGELANANISDYQQYATTKTVSAEDNVLNVSQGTDVQFKSASMYLKDRVNVVVKANVDGVDKTALKVTVKIGTNETYESAFTLVNDVLTVKIEGLAPTQYNDEIVVSVFVSDTQQATCSYSVNSYVYRMSANEKESEILADLYAYGVSAEAYAGTLN